MSFQTLHLTKGDISQIFNIQEDHFNDFKAKGLNGKQFSKTVSAFANASGGEIYVGIRRRNSVKSQTLGGIWLSRGCKLFYTNIRGTFDCRKILRCGVSIASRTQNICVEGNNI